MKSNIFGSWLFTSNILGRALFNLRLLEGRIFEKFIFLGANHSERKAEYSWVLEKLEPRGLILDIGCSESFLCYELSSRGEVIGVDIRPFKKKPRRIQFVLADLTNMPFKEGCFDTIAVVSTIEHIGLGEYGDPLYNKGDILAIRELGRILSTDGEMLLTTPVAVKYQIRQNGRIYDFQALSRITEGFLAKSEFYFPLRGKGWLRIDENDIESRKLITKAENGRGVACLTLRKKKVT
jgi:SAM-dependent methyltransferase